MIRRPPRSTHFHYTALFRTSLRASGRAGRRAAEQSRERLAEALGARPSEVLFTGGGTESDNLAVKGLFWARCEADSRRRRIVVSPAEPHAARSEEHTSELQSRHYLVCPLLL